MSIKLADTLSPMGDFEVAKAEDISVEIGGDTKMLQDAIDNGEIGGGDSAWTGTHDEWNALTSTEKAKHTVVYFTDDTNDETMPFKFGIDADGNYGYYKVGADSVTPFKDTVAMVGEPIDIDYANSGSRKVSIPSGAKMVLWFPIRYSAYVTVTVTCGTKSINYTIGDYLNMAKQMQFWDCSNDTEINISSVDQYSNNSTGIRFVFLKATN